VTVSPAFVLTCVLMVVAPGPSFAVIVNQSIRHGRRAGLLVVAGNTTALTCWAAASAFGLTVLIRTSEVAFTVLKVAGAGYLCFLGVRTLLRSRRHDDTPESTDGQPPPRTGLAAYRAGLLTNLTNPKAAVLYLALFPQFLTPGGGLLDVAGLAAVQMAISASWYVLVVLAVAGVRRLLARSVVRTWLDRATSIVLIGLGVRLAALARPLV
jgi:threonine/homoserine/homoserine lactone efflux protein